MRGIAGIVHFGDCLLEPRTLLRLISSTAAGTVNRVTAWNDQSAGMAHAIREVQPEDHFEAQPLRSKDGNLVLVTDAMLENRDDLAAAFAWSKHEAEGQPDSAFVLAAYEKWGEECPRRLDGRWAFAVWHLRERRLFAAVDHFSFRPLYYACTDHLLVFATTLRGVLAHPAVSREIHDGVLGDFLVGYAGDTEQSLFRHIKRIPAAHRLRADRSGVAISRYWEAELKPSLKLGSDAEYVEAFRFELEHAIRQTIRVNRNVGVMVSGGLDSAAVTVVAGRLLAQNGKRLHAFHQLHTGNDTRRTWGRDSDESHYVRRLEQYAPHIEFHYLPATDFSTSRVSLSGLEKRFADHWVPFIGITTDTNHHKKDSNAFVGLDLMLYGFGGNYVLSKECYPSCYFVELATRLRWLRLWRELAGHSRFYGRSIRHLVRHRILAPLVEAPQSEVRPPQILQYFQPDFLARAQIIERRRSRTLPRWHAGRLGVRRQNEWVVNHLMRENAGIVNAAISSEYNCIGHSPLKSRRLTEFCLSMPVDQQIRDGRDRLLLRRTMEGFLPPEVTWRTSRGYPMANISPATQQLLTALREALITIKGSPLATNYINVNAVQRDLISRGEEGLRRLGARSFVKLVNVAWFLQWLEKAPSPYP